MSDARAFASAVPVAFGANPAAIDQWVRSARPGERMVYFTGAFLVPAMPVVSRARALAEAGEVLTLQQRRPDGRIDYVVQKRANVDRRVMSRASIEEKAPGSATDDQVEQLMAVLRRLANLGLACPTNARLAEMAALKDSESARYRMSLLTIAGRIHVTTPPQGPRVVTIVSSGRSTAK